MNKHLLDQFLTDLKPSGLSLMKGEHLFLQGDQVEYFCFLKTGKIKLIRHTVEGGQALIHVALAGETFAEASLFSNAFHCSAIAVSASEIMRYKKSDLLSYLEQKPAAMKGLLRMFAQQVRDLRTVNEIKNIRSAKERIVTFVSNEMNEDNELCLSMPLKDVAYKIGMTHETFYRELKKLEQAGVLQRGDGYLKLL
ncbi:Crp/Fnr family transcriptional regulator [Mariprofundus sp. EBB-1]|uniref:Crp/Fnr family transcriptional regulator n=1 Tax=Mariprofundus sp. EBB-1 TaxID=2650971 RepID=UPI000EF1DE87|nr:Crp/Fnr family transcriptional regulator [Mariprofundus sp. EBB-1]RLL51743.1 Crp/Fnr family transcriptional regulator [Mariprofundus sp. EBB-1]